MVVERDKTFGRDKIRLLSYDKARVGVGPGALNHWAILFNWLLWI